MDYTINPDDAVDALLAQHAVEANRAALFKSLDAAAMEFCETINAIAGKEADPKMGIQIGGTPEAPIVAAWGEHKEALAEQITECEKKCAARLNRMTQPLDTKVLEDDKAAQLAALVPSWEAEHAQHGLHIELAESDEQVESSTISQLFLEGKITAARKLG